MTDREAAFPAPPSRWASRLAPSRVAAVAVLASIPAKLLSERLGDPDLWWHLKTGEIISGTRRIPRVDLYSFTVPGKRWVVQEWGSELILHALREAFGLWGIFFFRALMLFAVYVFLARFLVRRMGSGLGTWGLLALVAYAGASNWTERPNLFSFLLVLLTLELLERRSRAIWWFVPIAVVWANLHGMVVMGIGLVAVVAGAEALKAALRWPGADATWAGRLGLVTLAGALASLVNPAGPGLLFHAFRLIRVAGGLISEWASPDFHTTTAILFLALLLITVAALSLSPVRPDPTDVALVLAFTVLGLQAARNLAIASIVLGIVTARWLPGALAAIRTRTRTESGGTSSPLPAAVALLLALSGLAAVVVQGFPRSDRIADIVDRSYPAAAIDALNRPGVRLFSLDTWSDLAIDRGWPNIRVYYDTRVDLYGAAHARRYIRTLAASPEWRVELDRACVTHVLVRRRHALTQVLSLETLSVAPDWRVERTDARSVTFARRAPAAGCERYPIP